MPSSPLSNTWFFIVNPKAGNGKARRKWLKYLPMLQKELGALEWAYTEHSGHAIDLVGTAISQGYRRIIAVGGDGTNNEVINGIFAQEAPIRSALLYALLPIGTGNDWIRTHSIPKKIDSWISMIKKEQTLLHDIGKVQYKNGETDGRRYFINVAGLAYDAYVVQMTDKYKHWISNKLFYLAFTLACLFRYRLSKASIQYGRQRVEGQFYTINIGICRHSGGGMQLVPHAIPNNGLFALTLASKMSKLSVILNTPKFYNGRIGNHSKVDLSVAETIQIATLEGPPLMLEVDGEWLGYGPVEFSILKKALRVVVG